MKKKAFTLVELLAVIVILAIVLAIAVPSITGIINKVTRDAFEIDAKNVIKAINYKILQDGTFETSSLNVGNLGEKLNISSNNYESLNVSKDSNNNFYVYIEGKNKWNGLVACGTYTDIVVEEVDNINICTGSIIVESDYDEEKGVNRPKLAQGMVPIKWVWNEVNEIWEYQETTEDDSEWYEYGETEPTRRWANAVSKDTSGITAYWVWIPRYAYKITSCWSLSCSGSAGDIEISFSRGTDDTKDGTIDIINTCDEVDSECANDSNSITNGDKYTNHPAFTFGDQDITGFWVGKFEVSSSEPSASYGGGRTTGLDIKVLPGITSWRYNTVGNMFTVSRNMEKSNLYGWDIAEGELQTDGTFSTDNNNVDTHMMKNTEWGAVAYLSKSKYGKKSEIYINPSSQYLTGFAGTGPSVGAESNCPNSDSCFAYNTENGPKASTTGTVYGVYDMSGGAWEYTAAYLVDGSSGKLENGSTILSAHNKYKDNYTGYNNNKKGEAVYETSSSSSGSNSWYSDYSHVPNFSNPWFHRGGLYSGGSDAGVFNFDGSSSGSALYNYGCRVAA
ncbi:MAG: type II secretion system protein, partial [Bacilli bacterium]|nr:type II secretion system protein [Bacilli bacterium]